MKPLAPALALLFAAPFDAGSADRYPEVQSAIQRLSSRLAKAEARIEALSRRLPSGELRVYRVDTAAGTIRCEVCKFEEGEKQ